MNWSYRVARVAGIDIKIHVTFFLIVALGAFQWGVPHGPTGAWFGALLILLLFTCVTLHELGHSLTARMVGIPTREIVLLPLGGVAFLERNPTRPIHELVIAAAGPLVNVIIAWVLALISGAAITLGWLEGQPFLPTTEQAPSVATLLLWLLSANVGLVLFNLIPAFPLDGGRILRAILAMGMSYGRATRITVILGQGLAISMGLFGLLGGNLLLVVVAIFIFLSADQEHGATQARTVLSTRRVGDAYNKHALTLQIGDKVSTAVDYILTSYQPDFAVMQGSKPLGIVTRNDVLRALATGTRDNYVQEIMQRTIARVDADMPLDEVQALMTEQRTRVVAVYEGETFLGLVGHEDLAEAYVVIAFQQRQQAARSAALAGVPSPLEGHPLK
jgi:Zn-dependent protease